jgi:hypothetical protein
MHPNVSKLIEAAKAVHMSREQRIEQRNSFVYGNTKIENEKITRAMIEQIAQKLPIENERRA